MHQSFDTGPVDPRGILPKADQSIVLCRVVASGRSDYPHQINNVLVFPGFFRGLSMQVADLTAQERGSRSSGRSGHDGMDLQA